MIRVSARLAITPDGLLENALLHIEDGHIVSVSQGRGDVDFGDAILSPGYIDLHVHGGAGFDVMQASASELEQFERHLAKHGVTSYLATTVTAPEDATLRALERLGNSAKREPAKGRSQLIGIHLEGPFLSHAKRGVHPPECLRPADTKLFDRFYEAAGGAMKMMTFAPELEGGVDFIRHAIARDVRVSLGHSNANWAEAQAGIAAGAQTATHTFNAMRALDHRDPGILGAVLSSTTLMADIIADGVHVHPEMVKLFLNAKADERAMLITDGLSAAGMGDGTYQLGKMEVVVKGDRCEHNGTLGGSVLTLDKAVRNAAEFGGGAIPGAAELASTNPARMLGRGDLGVIRAGARADLTVLSPGGEVRATIVAGRVQ